MRSLLSVLLSTKGRRQLVWDIKQAVAENMYRDELREVDRLLSEWDHEGEAEAEVILKELRKNEHLHPECLRLETLHNFLRGSD